MNRRAFLAGIMATAGAAAVPRAAAALVAEPLAPGIGGTLVVSSATMRDLFLPLRGSYTSMPRAWEKLFAKEREGIDNG